MTTNTPAKESYYQRRKRREQLLRRVKEAVLSVLPDAEVILYGSRARGDARPDSDWDLLVLTDEKVDSEIEQEVWDKLLFIELDVAEVLVAFVHNREEWHSPYSRATPYYANVMKEGIVL